MHSEPSSFGVMPRWPGMLAPTPRGRTSMPWTYPCVSGRRRAKCARLCADAPVGEGESHWPLPCLSRSMSCWTPTGAPPTTCRSARSTCYDNPLLREPLDAGAHQAAAARPLGHDAGPQLHLRAPQPAHQAARPRHDLHHRPRPRRARRWSPTPISKAPTARSIPNISQDEEGMKRLFTQFSFPGGIPSHVAPETPGSIHEGGELGYALSHAYGAAFDNPDLIVACVVGDGEAETGPLATSWHSNKFLNPARDGAVLPILHLNGYKIANPTVLARISHEELDQLLPRLRLHAVFRRGRRSGGDAPADGRDARHGRRRDPARSRPTRATNGVHGAAALADDRAAHAQGLDRPEGGRRQADRGLLALASGAAGRDARTIPSTSASSRAG